VDLETITRCGEASGIGLSPNLFAVAYDAWLTSTHQLLGVKMGCIQEAALIVDWRVYMAMLSAKLVFTNYAAQPAGVLFAKQRVLCPLMCSLSMEQGQVGLYLKIGTWKQWISKC
jgi:hypothetical protein